MQTTRRRGQREYSQRLPRRALGAGWRSRREGDGKEAQLAVSPTAIGSAGSPRSRRRAKIRRHTPPCRVERRQASQPLAFIPPWRASGVWLLKTKSSVSVHTFA